MCFPQRVLYKNFLLELSSLPPGSISPPRKVDADTLAFSTPTGHKEPCSRDEYLAGTVTHHQRAQDTPTVWSSNFHQLSGAPLFSSPDDPELWDFTLNGINELDVPGPRPSTPGNHHMQTRSKTPQREPPPSLRPPARPQEAPTYRPQHHDQPQARTGEIYCFCWDLSKTLITIIVIIIFVKHITHKCYENKQLQNIQHWYIM